VRTGRIFPAATFGYANDFEEYLGMARAFRGCSVRRTEEASAFGRGSLEIRATSPTGLFRARLRDKYWSVNDYPRFLFDYRLPPGSSLELEVDLMGAMRRISLLGPRAGREYHGQAGPLVSDGRWHRASVDLAPACADELARMPLKYARGIYVVGRLPEGESGAMHLDNVELARRDWVSSKFEWEMPADASGVAGFSHVYDRMPKTEPPEEIGVPARRWAGPGDLAGDFAPPVSTHRGVWYFHVRAVDGAGNWGPAAHVVVDYGPGSGAKPVGLEKRPSKGGPGEAPGEVEE
jgi:hypothetical protein